MRLSRACILKTYLGYLLTYLPTELFVDISVTFPCKYIMTHWWLSHGILIHCLNATFAEYYRPYILPSRSSWCCDKVTRLERYETQSVVFSSKQNTLSGFVVRAADLLIYVMSLEADPLLW